MYYNLILITFQQSKGLKFVVQLREYDGEERRILSIKSK